MRVGQVAQSRPGDGGLGGGRGAETGVEGELGGLERLAGDRAAVDAVDDALAVQHREITSDGFGRHIETVGQLGDIDPPLDGGAAVLAGSSGAATAEIE